MNACNDIHGREMTKFLLVSAINLSYSTTETSFGILCSDVKIRVEFYLHMWYLNLIILANFLPFIGEYDLQITLVFIRRFAVILLCQISIQN